MSSAHPVPVTHSLGNRNEHDPARRGSLSSHPWSRATPAAPVCWPEAAGLLSGLGRGNLVRSSEHSSLSRSLVQEFPSLHHRLVINALPTLSELSSVHPCAQCLHHPHGVWEEGRRRKSPCGLCLFSYCVLTKDPGIKPSSIRAL